MKKVLIALALAVIAAIAVVIYAAGSGAAVELPRRSA